MDDIRGFHGVKYRALSNVYPHSMRIPDGPHIPPELVGQRVLTLEHAFQACKFLETEDMFAVLDKERAGDAKAEARLRQFAVRDDWQAVNLGILWQLLLVKFDWNSYSITNQPLSILLATYPARLFEENTWGDTFYGTVNGVGQNHLGLLLQDVRDFRRAQMQHAGSHSPGGALLSDTHR